MSSVGNIVNTRLLKKINKNEQKQNQKMPQCAIELRTATVYFPFSKKSPVSVKQTLDSFDLFRTQSCSHMLHREILSFTFLLSIE